jgi:hypothetical protein
LGDQAAALLVGTAEVTGLYAILATRGLANGALGLPVKEVLVIGVWGSEEGCAAQERK